MWEGLQKYNENGCNNSKTPAIRNVIARIKMLQSYMSSSTPFESRIIVNKPSPLPTFFPPNTLLRVHKRIHRLLDWHATGKPIMTETVAGLNFTEIMSNVHNYASLLVWGGSVFVSGGQERVPLSFLLLNRRRARNSFDVDRLVHARA